MGAILQPGGPASSSSAVRSNQWGSWPDLGAPNSPTSPPMSPTFTRVGEARGLANEVDFVLVISSDEPLLRRMNEIEGADAECVTVSTGKRGTDARWRLDLEEGDTVNPDRESDGVKEDGRCENAAVKVLERLAAVGNGATEH